MVIIDDPLKKENQKYGRFGVRHVIHLNITILKRQLDLMDDLVKADIYGNRSQIIRIALERFFESEYMKALKKGNERVIKKIKREFKKNNR